MIATRLTSPTSDALRLARDGSRRPEPLPAAAAAAADAEHGHGAAGSPPGDARPILRIAATLAAIALGGFTVVAVALLALLEAP